MVTSEEEQSARFAIVSSARSGSNMLQSLLDRHPEVRCYGEIFNPSYPLGYQKWANRSLFKRLFCKYGRDRSVQEYLDSLFEFPRDSVTAVGFKVMYPGQFNRCAIFPFYWQEHSFKIVRLVRDNLLRRYVSGQIARRDERWSSNQAREDVVTIRVTPEEARTSLRKMELINRNIDAVVAEFDSITVKYEQLVNGSADVIGKVCSFLGVSAESLDRLEARTARQNPYSLAVLIENYEEIRTSLRHTEYEWMLD